MSFSKLAGLVFVLAAALAPHASAQWDTSGNGLLKGTYYFREVIWVVGDNSGGLNRGLALYGNITFDGNGNYTISGAQLADSGNAGLQILSPGTYSISASGNGFLSSPISNGDSVYGLVSRGIFIGSSTESGFNDLFIAAPLASPAPTNASFQGPYTLFDLDFTDGIPADTLESQIQINPDGNGNIPGVRVTGYAGGGGSTQFSQNIGSARYFFSNGAANVNFGTATSSSLVAGTKFLYLSADGSFVFGGSPTGFDMIVGVRSPTATPNFSGLYYQAAAYQDESQLATGFSDLQTWYGSFKANAGVILGHQRFLSVFNNNSFDYNYTDSYALNADGTYNDTNNHYIFGAGGAIRLGIGIPPTIGISVAIQAPSFTPTGVFIDPTGIVNAASSALFTAGIAPGELISIYGSNLAPSLKVGTGFPTTLAGVQVLVNNRPAPIYFVSPNQISAVVPFGTSELIAAIQVINNNVASNTVTEYVGFTAPGVFTQPAGGLGSAAALHADFSLVTSANPAQPGETILLFVTGLGAVSPAVPDGTPGPVNPLSLATNTISVFIDGVPATTSFVGLAPQLIGLYQINVQVPTGVSTGNVFVDISGPDSTTIEATLPVGPGSGVNAASRAKPSFRQPRPAGSIRMNPHRSPRG
ncbi:MAG: hypothetical protein M3O35_04300 [Acidobacteriota bacterium]|nr:hypothetical protein [Acidobacteriota bacterium]